MAKIVKTLTVSWQWSGDKYSLRGFNLAVTPTAKNPKEEVVATAFVETNEIKQTYSYKMGNVTLDKDAQYKIWVQAVYENSDSDWVSTGGATVTDDGSATIITKTDREIQDIVNMASDNILTRQEKISLRREWQEIVYEFLEIESTAISQGIPSSNTTFSNFKSKGNALGTYLNGGATWTISSSNKTSFPLWINDSNLASNTSINGNTYRETFRVYYEAKVKILEEINKYKVNNVQIGGINLLTGTKDFNVGKGSGTIHSENYKGFSVLHKDMSSATSGTSDVCMWSNAIDVKQNTEYTLSFYAKGLGSFNSYFYPDNVTSGYSSEGKKTTASDGSIAHTLTSNWKKYWITWKTSVSTTGLKNVLPMRLLAGGVGYICGVKFEEGNKATDWSPSLEEMENAYTIILTNEAQVIPTNSNRVPTSSTTYFTDIQVYQGTVQCNDYTIGTVNSANGITVSKTSSRVNFAVSTNTALTVDGGNFTIPITIDGKTFNKTFSWSCSKQGNTGASGIGISNITEYYAVSSSNTTEPTSWSTTVPTMTATNKYLWNYETITYSNNTTVNTSKRVIGAYGDKGVTGSTGNGISKIVNYYLATSSSSGVTTSTSGWTTSVQSVSSSKKYLWNYEVVTYTNGSTNTTTPCIIGAYGDTGDSAKTVSLTSSSQVFKSTDGGVTFTPDNIVITPNYQNVSYSKWQYSTNGGSSWTDVSSSTNGVTYSSTSLTLSKSSTLFTNKVTSVIFKIITNNSSITDTITIVKLYDVTDLQIGSVNRLAKTNKSVTMSTNQTGTGYNVFDPYKTPSNKYLKDLGFKVGDKLTIGFNWSISQNGTNDLRYGNARAELCGKTSSSDYAYIVGFQPVPFATFSSTNTSGRFESTLTVTEAMLNVNGFRIRIDNSVLNLTISKAKLEKGNKATDWSLAPEELENAYSIILTNEAQVIPTTNSRVPTSSTTYYTDIQVYQGTTQRTDYTIGTINSANGITVSKTSSRVNFAVSTGTTITADGGNFTIPITIDGKTFNKTFSWSCSKQGNTGATGNAGQDAITIILSNENHTFPCESNGNIPTALSTTCVASAYKGATSVTPTIGAITNPTGMTITKNGATLTIQANTGTSLADSGTVNIPITVDGKTFNKTFTWSKAKKGATGATGATGAGAKTADIITSSQVFKSTDGGLTFSPTTITLTPKLQNVTYNGWQYSTNGGSTWSGLANSISGWSVSNGVLTISKDSSLFTSTVTSVTFRLNTNDSSVYDTMTIVKLYDVADLEIGGRNYLQNSNFANGMDKWTIHDMSNSTGTDKSVSIVKGGSWADPNVNTLQIRGTNVTGRYGVQSSGITLVANTTYTISGYCAGHRVGKIQVNVRDKQNSDANIHTVEYNPVSGGNSLSKYYKFETTFTTTSNTLFALNLYAVNLADNGYAWFANVKLEKGNKASDWIPAPEDVDKNINDVKDSLNSFQNTVNTSFKDGIIEQAEAKAIAQHLKTLDAEKADIDKEYSAIYSNANLTGSAKTNLASAKTSFDSAHASLKSTINTVISDGRVTSSESASVTSTFNTYNTQLGVYKQRVQEALDNISSGKVDKVEIGGRNLARKGSVVKYNSNDSATTVNDANFTTDGSATISRTAVMNEGAMIDRYVVYDGGVNYVAAFKMRTTSGTVNSIHIYNGRGHKNSKVYIDGVYKGTMGQDLTFPNDTNYHKVEVRFEAVATDSSIANAQNTNHIIPQPMKGTASAYTIQILNLKIEKGNKATDWTPAPEDVKNHAEQSAQNAVNAQTQNSIFNKLTNNGQTQGIYLENSKIYINGEYIKANTLSADKVLVGDYTNYCQLTEQTPMSDKFNKYTHSDSTIWHEMKTINRDTRISRDYSCKGGEKFRVTGYVYGKVTSTTSGAGSTTQENTKFRVAIFGKKTDGSNFWLYGDSETGSSTGSIVQFNKVITLPSNAKSFYVALQIEGFAPFSGVARCRNIEVRRMNTGELIVDGSITAKSLHSDVLSANNIVSIVNGGSTNISGNKIRTGTIQSNNGKSAINLDNGSMNLGTTSDSSYLQWTGSALNIKANSINIGSSSVATTTDVTNGVNNIEIGGRNLAKQTKLLTNAGLSGWVITDTGNEGFKKLEIVTENTGWQECNIPLYTEINTITRKATISFEYQETSSGLLMFSFGSYNGNTRVSEITNITVSSDFKVISTNGNWKTVCYTFDPTSVNNKSGTTQYKIQFKKSSGKTGTIYVRKPKIEFGTKATSWSPAPEDISADINTAKNDAITSANNKLNSTIANYYTKSQTDSQIKVAKDAITQSVSSTYETKTNVETKVNTTLSSAKSYADTKKSEAISSAATDATNKVNSAKNELNTAINKKANSADVYKKTEVYTKNETNSQITTAKNEINQSVSSTYETKTNVTTKLNNLSVSATNLLDNSAPLSTSGWSNWSSVSGLSTSMEVSTTDNSTHGKQGKITFSGSVTGNAGRHKSPVQKLTSGKTYSWSIWLRSGSGNLTVQLGQEQNGLRDVTVGTSWTRFTHTYTANDNQYYAFIIRPKNVTSSHSLYFHSVMLVEGDKPVAWQTSPTEVLSDKTSIEQRMKSAESKITDTAITNTVKQNFYTKEETEKQITSKGYQTASQVQQTVNNLQIKFTESGGYNLIRNSSGLNGTNLWTGTATLGTATNTNIGGACDKYMYLDNGTTTSEQFAYSSRFKLKPSTKYTLTGWFHNYTKCPSFDVFVLSSTSVDGSDTGTSYTNVHHLIQAQNTNGAWKKYTVSFTTPSGCKSGIVRIDNNGYNSNGSNSNRIHWSALILTEGALEVPWSPHPNEVYDGIIQMDKNGIKVSTSNGGWTDFTSVGMNVYNKSSTLSLGTRNGGLTYHSGSGQYLGFTSASILEAYNTKGVSISTATGGAYVSLGYSSATDPFGGFTATPCLSIAKQDIGDSSSFYRKGVNVHTTLNLNTQYINRAGTINFGTNNTSSIYESSANNLCMYGNNGVVLGYYEGSSNVTKFKITEGSSSSTSYIDSYAHWRFNQWNLTDVGQLEVVSRLKMLGTSSLYFNANATHPSVMWHASGDGKLKIFGDNGVDIGYREGDTNRPIFKITEGEDGAYRLQSFSHWHFNNWNLDYVGIVHAQRFNVAGTAGSYYITKGTGDGADYTTYGCLFYTHNGLAFTANGGSVTLVVQGRSGRIMGKNAYYVNSSKCLKSDIRAVTSESEPMPVNLKQGEVVDETLTMEMIGDFIDTIGIRTYITDFEQEGATQRDVDPQQGHVLNLGYIADDLAHHPVFKYIGEKTPDNLYAINSNSLTTVALAGLQAERKERRKLEQRLQQLEAMLLKGEE